MANGSTSPHQLGLPSIDGTIAAVGLHVPASSVRTIPIRRSPKHTLGCARRDVPPSTRTEKRNVNFSLRAIVVSLGMLILLSSGSGIAAAHTALANSDPAKDATATTPPTTIVLTFTEDINPAFANVVVSSADGRNWVSESPRVEGPRLTAAVGPDRLANGAYTVGYRVVSADGHPVTGSYSFTVAGVPVQASPTPTTAGAAPSAAEPPAASVGSDTKTSILTAAVAGLALGGAIAFWQSRKHRRKTAVDEDVSQSTPSAGEKDE